jgi:nucleolar complex protein 3
MSSRKNSFASVEDKPRTSFTPGWNQFLNQSESLPIKKGSRVIKQSRRESSAISDEVSEASEEVKDPTGIEEDSEDGDGFSREILAPPSIAVAPMQMSRASAAINIAEVQQAIASLCIAITAGPEKSFIKSKEKNDSGVIEPALMTQLFAYLTSSDPRVLEIAMLSSVIIFKDICPSYRVRLADEYNDEVMKAENLALKKYELNLAASYDKFLSILQGKTDAGLGDARRSVEINNATAKLGLSALSCQCELLKHLTQFNFRSKLLVSVAQRAAQPNHKVSQLCCNCLIYLFQHDIHSDTSYEAVQEIIKVFAAFKYAVSCRSLLQCLLHVKLGVRADEAKSIHRKSKNERRKRRKEGNDAVAEIMESNASGDVTTKKRFQADTLKELCVLYFRYHVFCRICDVSMMYF